MKIKTLILHLLLLGNYTFSQVGIGTTNPQAALDVRSGNNGLLIPRVSLSATNVATILTPTISELVYNTNTSTPGANQVLPGFYYWSGTSWIRLIASNQPSNDWGLNGNNATNTNFIGTTNDVNLNFKRNNINAGFISPDLIALGINALGASTTAQSSIAVGRNALSQNTIGFYNTAIGDYSLESATTSDGNTAVGAFALRLTTTGSENSAFGTGSLSYNTTGSLNVAIGSGTLAQNTIGNRNTVVGYTAMQNATSSSFNTAIGDRAMYNTAVATQNTALGSRALFNNGFGNRNTAIGSGAMVNSSSGNNNTAVGYNSLTNNTTGSNNTAIGNGAQTPVNTSSNQVRIGNNAVTYAGVQVAWSVTSDSRWKNDIKKSNLGLDFISQLNPVSYIRKSEDAETTKQKREYGFIAQELEQTLNNNNVIDNGIITKDDEGMLSVRYNDLLAPMVKAIQELNEKNKNQEKVIQELLRRIENLEKSK